MRYSKSGWLPLKGVLMRLQLPPDMLHSLLSLTACSPLEKILFHLRIYMEEHIINSRLLLKTLVGKGSLQNHWILNRLKRLSMKIQGAYTLNLSVIRDSTCPT